MKILLVEDDEMIGSAVQKGLAPDGIVVDWAKDAADAIMALDVENYEAVLLDLGLPDRPGLDVLSHLRGKGDELAVIIITARDAVAQRIAGLDAGADDYLVKPFDLDELSARIRAVHRRKLGHAVSLLSVGKLSLNRASHQCLWDKTAVMLSAKEFALLKALMERQGNVLSRRQLEEHLYGWDDEIGSNTVEVHVHNLRKKISPQVIRTVRGVGYMIGELS